MSILSEDEILAKKDHSCYTSAFCGFDPISLPPKSKPNSIVAIWKQRETFNKSWRTNWEQCKLKNIHHSFREWIRLRRCFTSLENYSGRKFVIKLRIKMFTQFYYFYTWLSHTILFRISSISVSVHKVEFMEVLIDGTLWRTIFCRQYTSTYAWLLFRHFKQNPIFQKRKSLAMVYLRG